MRPWRIFWLALGAPIAALAVMTASFALLASFRRREAPDWAAVLAIAATALVPLSYAAGLALCAFGWRRSRALGGPPAFAWILAAIAIAAGGGFVLWLLYEALGAATAFR